MPTFSCPIGRCTYSDPSQHLATVGTIGSMTAGIIGAATSSTPLMVLGGGSALIHMIENLRIGCLLPENAVAEALSQANITETHLQQTTQETKERLDTVLKQTENLQEKLQKTEQEKAELLESINALRTQLGQTGQQCDVLDIRLIDIAAAAELESEQIKSLQVTQERQTASLQETSTTLHTTITALQSAALHFSGISKQETQANTSLAQLIDRLHTQGNLLEDAIKREREEKKSLEALVLQMGALEDLRKKTEEATRKYEAVIERMNSLSLKTLPPSPKSMQ